MADDGVITPQGAAPQGAAPAGASANPAPAAGNEPAAVNWESKARELETQLQGLQSEAALARKYKEYFPEATPDDIKQGVEWAVNVYKQIRDGKLAAAQQPVAPQAAPAGPPWESPDFELLPASQQAKKIAEYQAQQFNHTLSEKEAAVRNELQQGSQLLGRQQNILLKAIQAAIKNPGVDVNSILQKAAEASQMPAEALIDQVLDQATRTPEAEEARINKLVEERLAQKLQERENEQIARITSQASRVPRGLASIPKRTVADENKDILRRLAEKGIHF